MRKTATAAVGRDIEFRWTTGHVVALAALCTAQLLEALDITVVNIALPTLQRDLGFSEHMLQWVITAYTVCFGGFLLLGGRTGDRYGHRRVFVAGTAVFGLASLACAIAPDAGLLVGFRGVQGVAAGFVAPMTLALLAMLFPEGRARTVAFTTWGITTAVSGSLGFVAGGLLVDGPGWRWIFAINPVICIAAIVAVLRFVPRDKPGRRGTFDLLGALSSTTAVALLVYGIAQIGAVAWYSPAVVIPLAATVALLLFFFVHEARTTAQPLIPPALWRIRPVRAANLVQMFISGGIYALFYLVSLELQQLLGRDATQAGLALVPFSALLIVCAGAGPLLVRYIGFRGSITIGAAIGAAGLLLLAHTVTDSGTATAVVLPSLVVAFGFALTFVPVTVAAVTGVPADGQGVASGLVNVTRTIGGALGLAVIAAISSDRTTHLLHSGQAHTQALAAGYRTGFEVAAAVLLLAVVSALVLFRDEGRGTRITMTAMTGADQEG
ncbi:DHA2 family efflux MFS transporter permease subunit [Nocardia sp. NPDC088792]|uniref:DHA2 family efflux MFS transporter permease subunit n=1 Tax=Nocardia sp. NPDC088792 TaxID=3364332 RepID=UPI0038173A74